MKTRGRNDVDSHKATPREEEAPSSQNTPLSIESRQSSLKKVGAAA